ncbi:uncharacterized protein [Nicotiana tomentosiformis]|uniref:uncharacterized protein n=1 Tax=Nicotiana tomentosiformis TaxID=4098 RepID=UPI00388CBB99
MEKVHDYDSLLAKTEKALDKAKEKIVQLNEKAESSKDCQVTKFEEERAQFEKEKAHWVRSEAQLHAQLEEMRRYNREYQHADFDREMAQARLEQARLRAQLESALDREGHIREIAIARQQQLQDRDQNFQYFKEQVHNLAVYTAQSYVNCQGMDYEKFLEHAPTFARHLAAELEKLTFKVPDSYKHTPHNVFPIEIEKPEKNMEQEEMTRKMKSLEQTVRNIQGLGGHKSVSFNDLCMFPHVHLPPGFKTPKFNKYDRNGDPVAHLKRYCNQLRGAGGKEELLMA